MSTPNTKRDQLIAKLKEMFQMDQADLDFGIYRIMNAKRDEVERFLDKDLLPTLRTTLEEFQPAGLADKQKELADAIANARKLKIDPDSLEIVQQLKAELAEGGDLDRLENQVYSDLHTFFSRYYQDGDFLSLRRYKEGVYAMPYEGEEVKLHWANADQYYIKTAENFTRYAFKTAQGRVRFELAAASTERDNNKATADNERRFILAAEPLAMDGDELIIRFEYRPDVEKRKQKELSTLAVASLLALPEDAPLTEGVPQWPAWRAALASALPSDKNKTRTVFEKHLTDYTAKNTFDYFIHKDLDAFLKRELDFFIKNEVMHLDDIEEDSAPRVESYLARIKAMRRISHKLIAFLAQLENFQRKLWLKKKFVLETQWLITLDRVPESFYQEICETAELQVQGWDGRVRSQCQEWVELFGIDKIKNDLCGAVPYIAPLTIDFLKANQFLVVDTAFFSKNFKDRLLANFDDIDHQTNAVLVHGENFQALNLFQTRLRNRARLIYIDPPYNTGTDDFIYKDNYSNSSWLSLMVDRLNASSELLEVGGIHAISLDSTESGNLGALFKTSVTGHIPIGEFVWKTRNTDNRVSTMFSTDHEYIHLYASQGSPIEGRVIDRTSFKNLDNDERGAYTTDPLTGKANYKDRPNLHYDIENLQTGNVYKPDPDFGWITDKAGFNVLLKDRRIFWPKNPITGKPRKKRFLFEANVRSPISSLGIKISQGEGNDDLSAKMGSKLINFPKPISVIKSVVDACCPSDGLVVDYFAGSGTTGDAVISLNRQQGDQRTFCLVEVGDHFDRILKPRIAKAVYSDGWSDGLPVDRLGLSFLCKYVRIESYEDTLNNLMHHGRSPAQDSLLKTGRPLRESYMLSYMLDVETRDGLLSLSRFEHPFNTKISVVRSNEVRGVNVDMIETFNYLLGLRVQTIRRIKDVYEVVGVTPAGDQALILWRDVIEVNNDALDEWFRIQAYSSRDKEFDLIYVNGDNNIENLRRADETWKIRLIEETFLGLMFGSEVA